MRALRVQHDRDIAILVDTYTKEIKSLQVDPSANQTGLLASLSNGGAGRLELGLTYEK